MNNAAANASRMSCRAPSLTRRTIIIVAVSLLAATWYGVFDVPFDPRSPANVEDARSFIRAVVNERVDMWKTHDSVTLCQSGSSRYALFVYLPNGTWAFGRSIDTRARPPESWLELLRRWLLGLGPDPGSLYDAVAESAEEPWWRDCLGVPAGIRITYFIEGYWRHGYINDNYAGSVFVGKNVHTTETESLGMCV